MASTHHDTPDTSQLQGSERERVIRKIKRCLALGESSNINEAQMALRQAQALMQQYRLSEADVQSDAVDWVGRNTRIKSVPPWHKDLATVSAMAFGCVLMTTKSKLRLSPVAFSFIGVAPGCELAAYAYDALLTQCKADRAKFLARCTTPSKSRAKSQADDFCRGWVYQVHAKLDQFARDNATSASGNALMVIAERDKDAINAWLKANHGDVPESKSREKKNIDAAAVMRGRIAGDKAEIRQGLGSTAANDQLALEYPKGKAA